MHRFQSKSTITRLRFAAGLVCLKWVMTPLVAGVLAYSMWIHDRSLTIGGLGLGVATLVVVCLQWIVASRTRCPLCMTPVLASKRCAKHRNAKRFLGSHRLRVALAVIFRGSFTCPYCHEPSTLEVRERHRR